MTSSNSNFILMSVLILCCLFSGISVPLAAQEKQSESPANFKTREQSAMAFAKEHHRELSKLLVQLKEMNLEKYRSAILELSRTSDRLARHQERSPQRYETELAIWKINSRVRLIVARSVSGMEEETREQVKRLLIERNQIRQKQLEFDRDRAQERLNRLNEQISQLENNEESVADKELDRLMKSVRTRSNIRKKNITATKDSSNPNRKKTRANSKEETSKNK